MSEGLCILRRITLSDTSVEIKMKDCKQSLEALLLLRIKQKMPKRMGHMDVGIPHPIVVVVDMNIFVTHRFV